METRLAADPIRVQPVPSELPLTLVVAVASAGLWILLAISIIGIVYALILALFFFIAHVIFVTHIRGNGIRLGPNQMPDLYQRVVELAHRMEMEQVPEAYLIQEGGLLNALATKFLKSNMIVLYSDLIEACGDNHAARDMIVAHELGHLKQGHLKWHWFLLPGLLMPFLGTTLSRAREYTCDRYGLAGAGELDGALRGLAILAAGAERGPKVNLQEMAKQVEGLNTGWMTIGQWLSTHPPLAKRIIMLNQALRPSGDFATHGVLRALGIIGLVYVLPSFLIVAGVIAYSAYMAKKEMAAEVFEAPGSQPLDELEKLAASDLRRLETFVLDLRVRKKSVPADSEELLREWGAAHPGNAPLLDPFGRPYQYRLSEDGFMVYSLGKNGVADSDERTGDDLVLFSALNEKNPQP